MTESEHTKHEASRKGKAIIASGSRWNALPIYLAVATGVPTMVIATEWFDLDKLLALLVTLVVFAFFAWLGAVALNLFFVVDRSLDAPINDKMREMTAAAHSMHKKHHGKE